MLDVVGVVVAGEEVGVFEFAEDKEEPE